MISKNISFYVLDELLLKAKADDNNKVKRLNTYEGVCQFLM